MDNLHKDVARKISAWGQSLAEKKGARDQLARVLNKEREAQAELVTDQLKYKKAHTFMMSELSERRSLAIKSIEEISTTGLQMVYDNSYGLKFDTFDEKRSEEGMATYKMEIRVNGIFDGKERSFILQGGKGGGLHDNIALILRDAALTWNRYDGFVMFDEAYKFMSRDEKIENVAMLLRQMADLTDRQYIFSTHMQDVFASVADNIVRFSKKDGIVSCEFVAPSDIVEIEEKYGTEEDDDRE
jgi:hypothetical protein